MKEVMAIIRMNKINATRTALADAGFPSFTARKVLGRGRGNVDFRILHGAECGHEEAIAQLGMGPRFIPKRLLTIVVPDGAVARVVDVIIRTNQTQKPGDGKIFICPISDAYRVRTEESGETAVNENAES